MKFLIQKYNGEIVYDFAFTLLNAIKLHNWMRKNNGKIIVRYYNSIEIDTPQAWCFKSYQKNYTPIGSVEFVNEFLLNFYGKELKPTNVPLELRLPEFTGRTVFDGNESDVNDIGRMILPTHQWFVKSNDKIKQYTNFHKFGDNIPIGNYQYSNKIHIESEWRAFIYKNKLVGLSNYTGEFIKFPDVNLILRMIDAYKSAPIAYTLDVGLNGYNTFVIEVHPMVSVGLYSFNDIGILPNMFNKAFNEIITQKL